MIAGSYEVTDESSFVRAFIFAYQSHGGKYRKGTRIPYIVHPIDVASVLLKNCASESLVVAGLLHDVVEDAGVELSEIEELFGEEVAWLVEGASEPEEYWANMSPEGRRRTWKERKTHAIDGISDAGRDLKLLSCADKLSNIRDMIDDYNEVGEELWDRLNATRDDQAWYYRSMMEAFSSPPDSLAGLPLFNQLKESWSDYSEKLKAK